MKRRDFFKSLPAIAGGVVLAVKSKPVKNGIKFVTYDDAMPYESMPFEFMWADESDNTPAVLGFVPVNTGIRHKDHIALHKRMLRKERT